MNRLEGKTAIVVGAGSIGPGWGNGKAVAVGFAREGARVVCADINPDACLETVDIIGAEGGTALAVTVDVTDAVQVSRMIDQCIEEFGSLNVLHNNVGIGFLGGVVDASIDEWNRALSVNVTSAVLTMKYAIPHMVETGGGSIINISSVAGIRWSGIPYIGYGASKAALNHLTRLTAGEYASRNIRVNAILPGMLLTPMVAENAKLAGAYTGNDNDIEAMWEKRNAQIPMGHMGDAWDVANAAIFLASDESKYVTGIELVVDGGLSLGKPS